MHPIIEHINQILQTHNRIGIFVSGGLDSALLSKLVLEYKNENNEIKFFTVPRYDDSYIHATRVVNYLGNFDTTTVGCPDLHHSKQVASGLFQALSDVDIVLLGDTTNPECLPNGPVRTKSFNKKIVQPFFDYTKDTTIKLIIDLGYTELFDLTHTCTESTLLRCKECWQCKERAWAFKQNNFVDTGTM